MAIYQKLTEAEERAIDALVLSFRVSSQRQAFESGTKHCVDALKRLGLEEAAEALEFDLQIPF